MPRPHHEVTAAVRDEWIEFDENVADRLAKTTGYSSVSPRRDVSRSQQAVLCSLETIAGGAFERCKAVLPE